VTITLTKRPGVKNSKLLYVKIEKWIQPSLDSQKIFPKCEVLCQGPNFNRLRDVTIWLTISSYL